MNEGGEEEGGGHPVLMKTYVYEILCEVDHTHFFKFYNHFPG